MNARRTARILRLMALILVSFSLGVVSSNTVFFDIVSSFRKDSYLPDMYGSNDMHLFVKRAPFRVFVSNMPLGQSYAYAVSRGNLILTSVSRSDDGSSHVDHFRNGLLELEEKCTKDGKRSDTYCHRDHGGDLDWVYIDDDDDGIWDVLVNAKQKKKFIWENGKWEMHEN